jgi:hypothetical protein
MLATPSPIPTGRCTKCIQVSKRSGRDVARGVIRGGRSGGAKGFPPDGLSPVDRLPFLSGHERRPLGQIQCVTHASMLGLMERLTCGKRSMSQCAGTSGTSRAPSPCRDLWGLADDVLAHLSGHYHWGPSR